MLTETTLTELRTLITTQAAPDRRADLAAALDDLQRTIAAQSLLVRNLTSALRNHQVGDQAMDAILTTDALNGLLTQLGQPRQTPFSIEQARQACAALTSAATAQAQEADLASIAASIVRVVLAFV